MSLNSEVRQWCAIAGEDLARLHKGNTIGALWPFTFNEAVSYIGPEFMQTLFQANQTLKQSHSAEEIARLFNHPSKISNFFMYFQGSRKTLSVEQRNELATDLIGYFKFYKSDFGQKTLNGEKTSDIQFSFDSDVLPLENRIVASMMLYLEMAYPTMMRLGHEFHGPYQNNAIIRDFSPLKASNSNSNSMAFKRCDCLNSIPNCQSSTFSTMKSKTAKKPTLEY
ncbi:MAG: hypothetical protein V1847_04655 [Candidatus Diapherotrites archaeon]